MKNSKIPLLPLYIADAIVLMLVLATALPSALRGETISTGQTLLCCIAVLGSMFMILLPYFWEYKKDIATKYEHTDEAQKNFEIIFDELASLRLTLADTIERIEKTEDNVADISQIEKNLINLKDSAKNKFLEYSDSIASLSDSISKLESASKNTKTSLEELGADLVVIKELSQANNDSILSELDELREKFATLQNNSPVQDDNNESDEDVEKDVEDETDSDTPAPRGKVEVGHLLKRALKNADDTKLSVEKFINISASNSQQEESTEELVEDTKEESEEIEEEVSQENENDDADFFELADSPEPDVESADEEILSEPNTPVLVAEPPDTNALLKRFDSEYEIKQAEKKAPKPTPKKEKVDESPQEETDMLFEDLPVSRGKIKPKKGDTVITVNALIGIGNTPYLRGDNAGLSQDKGIAMHYLEIGKWQYVIPDLDDTLNFSILKNDITLPQGESNFTINSGERKELNLFFPMEQELF